MKKILSIIVLVGLQGIFIYDLHGSFTEEKEKEFHSFELTFADGSISRFNKDNFPDHLILYYFTPDCKLCFVEVNDVVSYAKQKNINLLFVTTNELTDVKGFLRELKQKGINTDEENTMVARIKEEDVAPVFKGIVAPQCLLFGKGLEVKGVREGIITNRFLAKAFK